MSAISYRTNYGRVIRYALGGALGIHLLILLLSPPFEFQAYTMPPEPPPPLVDVEYAVTMPSELPPEPKPPDVTIESVGEPDDDAIDEPLPPEPPTPPRLDGYPNLDPLPVDPGFQAVDRLPQPLHMARAHYPDLAREAGIEGRVLIAILVDVDGKPLQAKVLTSEVTRAMEAAAVEAAMKSRFDPAYQRTRPVRAWVSIPFDFRLR